MPTTLTYGRKKPIQGEKGEPVFEALEDNIDLNDAHTHNGTDSAKLVPATFTPETADVASGSWAADGTKYKQTLTIPAAYSSASRTMNDIAMAVYEYDGADVIAQIYPTIERVSDTTFDIYSPVNTKEYRIVYL